MKYFFGILSMFVFTALCHAQNKAEVVTDPTVNSVDTGQAFSVVEIAPEFPGGSGALLKFLSTNIKYPTISAEQGIQGSVYVSFIVERDGSISEVKNVRGVTTELDAEAIRVVKAMPNWTPGRQDGKAVRVKFVLPIRFRLD